MGLTSTVFEETAEMAQAMPVQADPLEQLRDIHLPGAIGPWPPALGWWLLALLALALIAWGLFSALKYWQANRYRAIAQQELKTIYNHYQQCADTRLFLVQLQLLLKRVALHAYPREKVASLNGIAWVTFLDKSSGSREFRMGAGQALIDSNYTREVNANVAQLQHLGHLWIKQHNKLDDSGETL